MPAHVLDESGEIRILSGFGQDGGVPGRRLATAFAFQRTRDHRRAAGSASLGDQAIQERHSLCGASKGVEVASCAAVAGIGCAPGGARP